MTHPPTTAEALKALERVRKFLPHYGLYEGGKQDDEDIAVLKAALSSVPAWRPISDKAWCDMKDYLVWNGNQPYIGFYDAEYSRWFKPESEDAIIPPPTHWQPPPSHPAS